MTERIVIIGGGWAGLAAGVRLSREGLDVTILEASPSAGGRARSVPGGGMEGKLDWGQHLFLGCYGETKKLLGILGTHRHLKRVDSPVAFYDRSGKRGSVKVHSLPSPLHLAGSFFSLSHLGIKARLELGGMLLRVLAGSGSRREELERITAMTWLRSCGQGEEALEKFWRPLVVSALNEEPERASASMLEVVLRVGFFSGGEAAAPELPDVPLGELVAEPARRLIEEKGGEVRVKCKVEKLKTERGRVKAAVLRGGEKIEGDLFIAAVAPRELMPLLESLDGRHVKKLLKDISTLRYSPIVTLFIRTEEKIIDGAYAGLLGGNFHWIFDRTGLSGRSGDGTFLCSLVRSAAREMTGKTKEEIVNLALEDIKSHFPGVGRISVLYSKVVKDRRATFSPLPCISLRRPGPEDLADMGILLAGDWTGTGLPATLEGAVVSGFRCAGKVTGG